MDRVKWIEAKGKKILSMDYSGLKTTNELTEVLDAAIKETRPLPAGFLGLSNFADSSISSEFMDKINKTDKAAVLGVTGVKSVLFQAYLRFTGAKTTRTFNSQDEAIAYLVS